MTLSIVGYGLVAAGVGVLAGWALTDDVELADEPGVVGFVAFVLGLVWPLTVAAAVLAVLFGGFGRWLRGLG